MHDVACEFACAVRKFDEHSRLRALCNFFRAMRSPPQSPKVAVRDYESNVTKSKIVIHPNTYFTAPFNNMRTLKFKTQPTNSFFATVNQMFGGSSQLPTTAERAIIKSLCTVQTTKQVLCSSRKLGGPGEHLIDGSEKPINRSTFQF